VDQNIGFQIHPSFFSSVQSFRNPMKSVWKTLYSSSEDLEADVICLTVVIYSYISYKS
jgi:hypothetical protein